MPVKLSPLIHIEIVVRDAEETFQFLHDVFGAEKIEEGFAGLLDSPFMKIIHVGLGEVVLQLCQPILEEGSHHEHLSEKGPGVHNLTYFVEDIEETVKSLENEDVATIFSFPLDMIEWDKILGAENTRSDLPSCYIMSTMERIGFHLELAEAPWQKEPDKPVLYPAYSQPRPRTVEKVSPLLHIGVVVRDVDDTCQFLHKVFGSEKLEKESTRSSERHLTKVIDVKLGNVVLQYYQPEAGEGFLYRHLKGKGPGVHHLAFFAENVDEIVKAIEARGGEELPVSSLNDDRFPGFESLKVNDQPVYMINTKDNLGFQTALLKKSM